jgi:hypothetical protein
LSFDARAGLYFPRFFLEHGLDLGHHEGVALLVVFGLTNECPGKIVPLIFILRCSRGTVAVFGESQKSLK